MLVDFELPPHSVVKTCPLVAFDGSQHKEMQEDRPYLKQMMQMLDTEPIYYYDENGKFVFM